MLRAVNNEYELALRQGFEKAFINTAWYKGMLNFTLGEGDLLKWTASGYLHPFVNDSYLAHVKELKFKFLCLKKNDNTFAVGQWVLNAENKPVFLVAGEYDDQDQAEAFLKDCETDNSKFMDFAKKYI